MTLGIIKLDKTKYEKDKVALIRNIFPQGEIFNKHNACAVVTNSRNKILSVIDREYYFCDKDEVYFQELCECKGDINEMFKIVSKNVEIKKYLEAIFLLQDNKEYLLEMIQTKRTDVENFARLNVNYIWENDNLLPAYLIGVTVREGSKYNSKKFFVEYDKEDVFTPIKLETYDDAYDWKSVADKACKLYGIYLYDTKHDMLNKEIEINGIKHYVPNRKVQAFIQAFNEINRIK